MQGTTTLSALAREASDAFEQGTRPDGETFRRVRNDAPDWITVVERCHWCGALETDRYVLLTEACYEDAGTVMECENESACHARFESGLELDTAETLRDTLDAPTGRSGGLPARCEGCGAHCNRGELCAGCRDDLKREGT